MKRSLNLLGALCGLLLLSFSAPAQAVGEWGYFSNFDSGNTNLSLSYWIQQGDGTYTMDKGATSQPSLAPADLVFPHAWVTTDQYQDDGLTGAWGYYTGDKWAAIGGFGVPSAISTELWSPVNASNVKFNVDFGITASSPSAPTQDNFKWTVRDTAGNKLFAIAFKPVDSTTYGLYTENAAGVDAPVALDLTHNAGINIGSIYGLTFTTDLANHTYSAALTPLNANLTPADVALTFGGISLPSATGIGAVAATYELSDPQVTAGAPTNSGDNLMLFDNYQVIPEPSTVALCLGGLGLLAAIQRRRNRAVL